MSSWRAVSAPLGAQKIFAGVNWYSLRWWRKRDVSLGDSPFGSIQAHIFCIYHQGVSQTWFWLSPDTELSSRHRDTRFLFCTFLVSLHRCVPGNHCSYLLHHSFILPIRISYEWKICAWFLSSNMFLRFSHIIHCVYVVPSFFLLCSVLLYEKYPTWLSVLLLTDICCFQFGTIMSKATVNILV